MSISAKRQNTIIIIIIIIMIIIIIIYIIIITKIVIKSHFHLKCMLNARLSFSKF